MATDSAESRDLLTPRWVMYLALIGALPVLTLWRVRLKPATGLQALASRLALTGAALLMLIALILISSAFYASFVREHKELRYYANPLTPIYGFYKYTRAGHAEQAAEVQALGLDARIPPADIDRELVIMVVGETARADRFSLNGYGREKPTRDWRRRT